MTVTPLPEPDGPLTVGFAGRLLDDKGVRPLVQAVRSMRAKGANVVLLIAGTPDPADIADGRRFLCFLFFVLHAD